MTRGEKVGLGFLVAAAVVVALRMSGTPRPAPNPDWPEPSAEIQQAVAPIRTLVSGSVHKPDICAFYLDFASVLVRDDSVIKTTADIREGHRRAQSLMFQRRNINLPGLDAAINGAWETAMGLENKPLDRASRDRAVEVFAAIGWACR